MEPLFASQLGSRLRRETVVGDSNPHRLGSSPDFPCPRIARPVQLDNHEIIAPQITNVRSHQPPPDSSSPNANSITTQTTREAKKFGGLSEMDTYHDA